MCRVVARASAWTQAEGGIVNIIAMTDVSACHWGSAGNTMLQAGKPVPRQESPCPGGNPVPRQESSCPGGKPCAMARKLVQENLYPKGRNRPKR